MLTFTKMNGAGNDFILLDNRAGQLNLPRETIARLCDRHRGIGADGLLAVELSPGGADFRMRYYNSDGGEAEMCGNGARCFARYAARLLEIPPTSVSFETPAGIIRAALLAGGQVELAMSEPKDYREPVFLPVAGEELEVHFLNTGVPHAVVFVADLDRVEVTTLGAGLRYHEAFAPRGTNVNFVQILAEGELAIRTYERGVEGETLACGTGVVASALLYHLREDTPANLPIGVRVRGGDRLEVSFTPLAPGQFAHVRLRGPADFVFEGKVNLE
jgi:diaminopimelate epimerase